MPPIDYTKIITIEAGKRSGQPCIRGMRMTVYDVLEYLAAGMSEQEILDDFPYLTLEDIRACLAFAADMGRRLVYSPAPLRLHFDQNLSPQLVHRLRDLQPGAMHVFDIGLHTRDDAYIWEYARDQDLTIVSKDTDFRHRSASYGQPPKVIWIGLGNCTTEDVAALFQQRHTEVLEFSTNVDGALLALT